MQLYGFIHSDIYKQLYTVIQLWVIVWLFCVPLYYIYCLEMVQILLISCMRIRLALICSLMPCSGIISRSVNFIISNVQVLQKIERNAFTDRVLKVWNFLSNSLVDSLNYSWLVWKADFWLSIYLLQKMASILNFGETCWYT